MADDGTPPNVLLVVLDAARADEVSLEAGAQPTPNVGSLAEQGTVFERAIAPAPWTLPSVTSLLTGLDPHEHGAGSRGFRPERGRPLQRDLGEAGYRTVHVSPKTWIGDWLPQGRGFDTVREFTGPEHHRFEGGADVRELSQGVERGWAWYRTVLRRALAHEKPVQSLANVAAYAWTEARHDAWLDDMSASRRAADAAVEALARAGASGQQAFVFVHLMDPHLPFYVPEEARTEDIRPPRCESWEEEVAWMSELMDDIWAIRNGQRMLDEPELAYLQARYRDELRLADRAVGRMLAGLEELGLAEDTLVALTADHGEHLGERVKGRTMLDHQASLRLPVLHVPLVLRHPGVFDDGRREDLVQPHDLAHTIRELAGLEHRSSRSLADTTGDGDRVAVASYRGVVASHPPEGQSTPFLHRSRCSAVHGEWKLDAAAEDPQAPLPAVEGPDDVDRAVRLDWSTGRAREVPIEAVPEDERTRLIEQLAALGSAPRRASSSPTGVEEVSGTVERRLRRLGYLG